MLRLSTIAFAALLAAGAAQAGALPDRVAKAIADRVAAGTYPAVVVGIVDNGRNEVYAFGSVPGGKPDGDTVFEIGSITKTFTATLLADAVLAKTVSLDDPVAKLLPDFTVPAHGGKQITLASVATQHSGLPRMPGNFAPADPHNPYADYGLGRMKAFLAGYALPRDPGASYEYSNLGFGLLGEALANGAHADYRALLSAKILKPLGMTATDTVTTDAMRPHLAPGHDDIGAPVASWDFQAFAGAGAIRSSVNDMLRYLRANMAADRTPLADVMTLAHAPRESMDPDKANRIGLAWMTRTPRKGQPIVWHNGETGGYASAIAWTADGRRGVVILSNAAVEISDLAFAALDDDAPLAPAQAAIALLPDALAAYAGRYKITDIGLEVNLFMLGGRLYAQATGQQAIPLFPSAKDEFFARVAGISMSFTRDAKGAIAGYTLHQGADHPAVRLAEEPTVTFDAATLAGYAGRYELAPGAVFTLAVENGQLFAQLAGQPALPIFASAKDKFFYKAVDAQIDFERDAAGAIVALTLHQNGRDLRAPRLKE